jgi:hypothetical protein
MQRVTGVFRAAALERHFVEEGAQGGCRRELFDVIHLSFRL